MLSPHGKINFQMVQETDFLTFPALHILESCIKTKIRPKKIILGWQEKSSPNGRKFIFLIDFPEIFSFLR